MIYLGIDPGKSKGAIAYFSVLGSGRVVDSSKAFPKIGKEFDIHAFDKIIKRIMKKSEKSHFVLEDVGIMRLVSKSANCWLLHNKGQIEGILAANGCAYTLVTPKVWQAEMFQGVKKQRKASTKKKKDGTPALGEHETKKTALLACKRLYPDINLLATERSSVPHDGIVDAVLMAGYCMRKFK
jgi:hypothetical protein